MIIDELKNIISKAKQQNYSSMYIRSMLKEYLQTYVLNFIYLDHDYSRIFIFTGGTCLRHCFGLNRLSEDLDFDLIKTIDAKLLASQLKKYFKVKYQYQDVGIFVLQKDRQILLKFPVLYELGIASRSESNLLHVKIDISQLTSPIFNTLTTLKSVQGFNYLVTHYDLPSLMAGKITAILTRSRMVGKENISIIKGRDYFDLLWYLQQNIIPNLSRINDILKTNYSFRELFEILDEKVKQAVTVQLQYFKQDLIPFIDNSDLLDGYLDGYLNNYIASKKYLFI